MVVLVQPVVRLHLMAEEVLGFALEDYKEMPKVSTIEEVKKYNQMQPLLLFQLIW